MHSKLSPSQEYLKSAVLTATPEQLHLMLYDGAIKFATRGLEALRANDREAAFHALDRAQRIVAELTGGVRREVNPELADRMLALYSFVYRRLIDGNVNQDQSAVDEALRILRYQRETWVLLMQKLQRELGGTRPGEPAAPTTGPSAGATTFSAEA